LATTSPKLERFESGYAERQSHHSTLRQGKNSTVTPQSLGKNRLQSRPELATLLLVRQTEGSEECRIGHKSLGVLLLTFAHGEANHS
jgi:hypothetical protein